MQNIPGMNWISSHPRLSAWIALSVGMVALLVIEARDVGLLLTQWIALIIATVLVAGACIWIISWEDDDPTLETPEESTDSTTTDEKVTAIDS